MLLRQYRLLFIKPNGSPLTSFHSRAWVLPALILPFFALAAGLLFLGGYFVETQKLQSQLEVVQSRIPVQRSQLLDMSRRLQAVQNRYSSVRQLNAKLRIMLQMDALSAPEFPTEMGGLGNAPLYAMLPLKGILPVHLHKQSQNLTRQLMEAEVQQQEIIATLSERKDYFDHMPSIWPVKGRFSSGFGYRPSPFTGKRDFHKGIDITGPRGTPIYAPASGVITFAGRFSTYGKVIRIDHGNGIKTLYAHLHKTDAKVGQEVTRGELIGYVGNTGRSTAPHLPYEVHVNDKLVDPMHYILN